MDIPGARGRYRLLEGPDGPEIGCINTPGIRLVVRRGWTVGRRAVRRLPPRTILLDGVHEGPPFHDHAARRYSLDHHEGCLRTVTLSTCEQAATLVVLGMPLREGEWLVGLNEPDLDALLAAWILLNHLDLMADDARLLRDAMPLLRVEGVIDVHGLGREILTGLPPGDLALQAARIEQLMEPVRALKANGGWASMDAPTFTLGQLEAVDRILLPSADLARLLDLEEVARIPLRGQRWAVLCRSTQGIYEVEAHLGGRYGKALGLVVLDAGNGRFTLRRTDAFLDAGLGALYRVLNRHDPRVPGGGRDGEGWGGADEIGGSPRATGSGLSGREILAAVDRVYGRKRPWWQRLLDWVRGRG